jgi:sulfur carrier protein
LPGGDRKEFLSHFTPHTPVYTFPVTSPIRILVNGAPREFAQAPTVAQVLEALELAGRRLAIERNGEIVPRSRFGDEVLAEGDRIEVVMAVGGG